MSWLIPWRKHHWARWFTPKQSKRPVRPRTRLRVEPLEERTLLDAAALLLQQTGFPDLLITDNGAGDAHPGLGAIVFRGSYGDFAIGSIAASSNSASPPANQVARLSLGAMGVINTAGSSRTLQVTLTDDDFAFPTPPPLTLKTTMVSSVLTQNGSTTVTFQGFGDAANASFGTGFPVNPIVHAYSAYIGSQMKSGTSSATGFNPGGPYALTSQFTLDLAAGARVNSSSGKLEIPQPPQAPTLGSVSGFVYEDTNNDGVKDPGENGISGVTVTLTGTNDQNVAVNQMAITNSSGAYSITGLRASDAAGYTLTETQPTAYLDGKDAAGSAGGTVLPPPGDTISSILLGAGVNATNYNFGELLPASLSGFVYEDFDNDGAFEPFPQPENEAGIIFADVTLTGTDDLGNAVGPVTVTTDINGFYTFPNLRPGDYTLTESQPAGYLDGKDTIGTPGGTTGNDVFSNILLGAGVNGTNNNFGELPPASLSGYVYLDANDDAFFNHFAEIGINGVTVTLTGTDDLGNAVNLPMTTATNPDDGFGMAVDGYYLFANLRPSDGAGYTITETQPNNFIDGQDSVGTAGGIAGNDVFTNIVLTPGIPGDDYNFGELLPNGNSSLSGFVYSDIDNDGVFDVGEVGIGGATVTLTGTANPSTPITITTSTAADGSYLFANLPDGTYTLTETQPAGFLDGKDTIGTPGGDDTVNDVFSNIVLGVGVNGTDNNFGELLPSSLSGFVYFDIGSGTNANNGIFDSDESGIFQAMVTLTGVDDLGNPVFMTTTTDINGSYSFNGLRPGTYEIHADQVGTFDGKETVGTLPAPAVPAEYGKVQLDSNGKTTPDLIYDIMLNYAGLDGINYNFGELDHGS